MPASVKDKLDEEDFLGKTVSSVQEGAETSWLSYSAVNRMYTLRA